MDTELTLLNWRSGQTSAERLCANLLILEGYSSVDPQCPLGGPDGLKDVLCARSGWNYVGAAYFATEGKSFSEVKRKFKHDLKGVAENSADGLIFLTNQKLSPEERRQLESIAQSAGHKAIIYHRERIRVLLDSPLGFPIRLEHLNIEMSPEEQLSFFSMWERTFAGLLQQQSDYIIEALSQKLSDGGVEGFGRLEQLMQGAIARTIARPDLQLSSVSSPSPTYDSPFRSCGSWTVNTFLLLHAALMFEGTHPEAVGTLRKVQVWVGNPGSDIENAKFVPPPAENVPELLNELISWWQNKFQMVSNGTEDEKLKIIAEFHGRLLSIHPFLDGNGRLAKFLLTVQAIELLGVRGPVRLSQSNAYFTALEAAHGGDFSALEGILSQAIYGTERQ